MVYKCHDTFMVRTPAFPLSVARNVLATEKSEVWNYIKKIGIDEYMLEAIFVSSPSLYDAILKIGKDNKKDQATFVSLYKYLLRASSRTTPIGLMATVGLGHFSLDEESYIEKKNNLDKKIMISYSWIYKLVKELQQDQNVLDRISVVWNKNTYMTSSRIINPYFANHGVSEQNEHKNVSIKSTKLTQFIKDNTENSIKYSELIFSICGIYKGVCREKIVSTINALIEKEFLFTELRIPAYCDSPIEYILSILRKNNINTNLQYNLKKILHEIKVYEEKNGGVQSLKKTKNTMEKICSDKLYIDVNTGMEMKNNALPLSIKNKLEKFVETVSEISTESKTFSSLKTFKAKFQEEYGIGVEVPLVQVIDPNGFNGLTYYSETQYNPSERDFKIKNIVDNKVQEAVFNGEKYINLDKGDFKNIAKNDQVNYPKSFDLNIMIYKSNEIKMNVGANFGASVAGKSFQRFAGVFEKEEFKRYNKIYDYSTSDECLYVDLLEMPSRGRFTSLLNVRRNYPYTLALSMSFNKNTEYILLDDLVCGMTEHNRMYIKSVSKNKVCKMITDNMLNPKLNSKLFNFIKDISSDDNELEIVDSLAILSSNNYIYTPGICIEGVKIVPEKWVFRENLAEKLELSDFKKNFEQFSERYNLPKYFYLCKSDNLLPLRKGGENTIEILYKEFKRTRELEIASVENDLFENKIAKDISGDCYALECIFSFYNTDTKNRNVEHFKQINTSKNIGIQNINRVFAPFENGWVYLNVYISEEMENTFLNMLESKKKDLLIDNFFFVRYIDEIGRHIRLRIKYRNTEEALERYLYIRDWLSELKKNDIFRTYTINEYHRENNRYGGSDIIESMENIFFENSEFVIRNIRDVDMGNPEIAKKIYFKTVSYFLGQILKEKKEMYTLLKKITDKNEYRKEYKSKRKEYMKNLEDTLHNIQNSSVIDSAIVKLSEKNNLSNHVEDIILSLIHMCCNRLNGSRELESYTYGILRHTLYDCIQRDRALKIIIQEQNK